MRPPSATSRAVVVCLESFAHGHRGKPYLRRRATHLLWTCGEQVTGGILLLQLGDLRNAVNLHSSIAPHSPEQRVMLEKWHSRDCIKLCLSPQSPETANNDQADGVASALHSLRQAKLTRHQTNHGCE